MKPDKHGFWWCKKLPDNTETIVEIIDVTSSSSLSKPEFIVRIIGHYIEYDLDLFSRAVEWIGEAVPPSQIDRSANSEEKSEAE